MYIEEMINKLIESPDKEFKNIPDRHYEGVVHATIEDNKIFFKSSSGNSSACYYIDLDWEWEEIKKPVNFITALRSGKRIMVDHELIYGKTNLLKERYNSLDKFMFRLSENLGAESMKQVLLEGEFYIQGQEDKNVETI